MIELASISRIFTMGDQEVRALDHIDLSIAGGEYVSVMGPSGSGKSTLLNIIGLLDRPTSGRYLLGPEDVSQMPRRCPLRRARRAAGFCFSVLQEKYRFADLLFRVADIDGIRRVRLTSPHPKDFPDDLLRAVNSHPRICKHIHLPLQAGSDRILKLMNRGYTAAQFLTLVDKIRALMPEIILSTDIILRFPTETRASFEDTVRLMETVQFDAAFIFNYSERKGTCRQAPLERRCHARRKEGSHHHSQQHPAPYQPRPQ